MLKVFVLALIALVPLQAAAATCVSFGPQPAPILVVDVKQVGAFFSIAGELVNGAADPCPSFPLSGSAHLRPDGKAHFGLTVDQTSVIDPGCVPLFLTGTVDPPSYNSGTVLFRRLTATSTSSAVLVPVACPALPQRPASARGSQPQSR